MQLWKGEMNAANPMAPVTLVVRYNTYETWRRPEDKPGALIWRRFSDVGMMLEERQIGTPALGGPRPGRPEPESVRHAIDRAAGKDPAKVRREGHVEVLTYEYRTIEAADKAGRRLRRQVKDRGYSVQAVVMAKRSAVVRGKERRR